METQSSPKHLMNNTVLLAQSAVAMVAVAEAAVDASSERRKDNGSRCSFSSSSEYSSSAGTMSLFDVRCQSREQLSEDIRLRDNAVLVETLLSTQESFGPRKSIQLSYNMPSMTIDPEVDCRDTPPTTEPLHIVGALEDLPPATRSLNKTLPTPVTPRKPPLTLSAFRRPEETVRLTNCDASRLLENEYNLRAAGCRVIGHGAFSTVRLAVRFSDGQKVAVKSISKYDALRARRLRRGGSTSSSVPRSRHMDEWEIMRLLKNNPYVLALFDVFETDEEIHLVTEYCEGGELFDAIKRKGAKRSSFRRGRYSEAQAARITDQILRALLDLHDLGIVHRDIKPENILLLNSDESDIQVKLADFGMARLHTLDPSVTIIDGESSPSTPGLTDVTNAPPEICNSKTAGPAADIFSLGVTLYILLCGFPPVFCDGLVEFPDAYWGDISDEAKAVVRAMVHPDPARRISVRSALTNPWVRQQATRVRRDSISANLELVRSRLHKALGDNNSPSNQKRRRGSLSTYSPKKQRRLSTQLTISMTDLYSISEKRDVRVIDELIETHPIVEDVSSEQ